MASNLEVVTQLMEYSRSGPLMQVMIFQALDQFNLGSRSAKEVSCAVSLSRKRLESLREEIQQTLSSTCWSNDMECYHSTAGDPSA
ncbi:hypothetical protein P4053_16525 [Pseudomonas aeruginosa]|nr:hypothetical protein [Pseudomonas aeruginosa]